jgi:hypothetical protein
MNTLDCFKISHNKVSVWLLSVGDKLFGEVKSLEKHKSEIQKFDTSLNWLILDVVEENSDVLAKELNLSKDDLERQFKMEQHIRSMVSKGSFGGKYFKSHRETIDNLLTSNSGNSSDRVLDTVSIGLKYRFVRAEDVIETSENKGYILETSVQTGQIKIGMTDDDLSQFKSSYTFGENLIYKINSFLLREYNGLSHDSTETEVTTSEPTEAVESESEEKKIVASV